MPPVISTDLTFYHEDVSGDVTQAIYSPVGQQKQQYMTEVEAVYKSACLGKE